MKLNSIIFMFLIFTLPCNAAITIATLFGNVEITEPVLCQLIESPAMQRLKHIHQYGITYYLGFICYPYSRFDHSLGVLYIVRHFGGSLKEQIAALLHDVSHTVFSHVGDYVFKHSKHNSYQDDIHAWFINQTTIPEILARHNLTVEDILHKHNGFTILEQDLPALCADRIEYILHGAFLEHKLTHHDIHNIVHSLHFQDGNWFFDNPTNARKLADAALYLNEYVFCSPENFISYALCAQILLTALEQQILTLHDIHFGYDQEIWEILNKSNNTAIKRCINSMLHQKTLYDLAPNPRECSFHAPSKCRAVNPLIKIENHLYKLTEYNTDYKNTYDHFKHTFSHGFCFLYKDPHAFPLTSVIGR